MNRKVLMIGGAVLSSVLASICCITPIVMVVAGMSGLASAFSWLSGLRPYLVIMAILSLGFAWYQNLYHESDCDCEESGAKRFFQSRLFLGLVTALVLLTAAFPYYSGMFYWRTEKEGIAYEKMNLRIAKIKISGMTCAGCAKRIQYEVEKLKGIIKSDVSYENGTAIVTFDKSKIQPAAIVATIYSTGYEAVTVKTGGAEWRHSP